MRTTNKILLLIAFCLAVCVSAVAQNNPYKFDDRLYTSFVYMQNHRREPATLERADSLYREAVRYGDKKAQCAILCTLCQYAVHVKDEKLLKKSADRLREVSLNAGFPQYYVFAYNQEVVHLVNNGRFTEALSVVNDAEDEMNAHFKGKNMESIYQMYGNIYSRSRNHMQSLQYYEKSLDVARKNNPEQDMTDIYSKLVGTYRILGRYDDALKTADEGLANIKVKSTVSRRCTLLREKCYVLYLLGRNAEAEVVYKELKQPQYAGFHSSMYDIDVYHNKYLHQYDKALSLVDKVNLTNIGKSRMKAIIAKESGDYATAYDWLKKALTDAEKESTVRRTTSLAEFYVTVEKQNLDKENAALNLEHNQLALHEAEMALAAQRNEAKTQRMNAENMKLKLRNKELSLSKLREENEKQRLKASLEDNSFNEENAMQRSRRLLLLAVIGLLLVLLLTIVTYMLIRMRTMRKLREKNEDLKAALAQAEESEHVKMRFLRNMNHEIRTPLNAIVGFAQMLIHDEGNSFTPEQKAEYIDLVDQNTQGLTDLINDILNISAIENNSDKIVKRRLFYLDELCRGTVANANLRCPDGVGVKYRSEVGDKYMAYSDSSRIRQVLLKLLNNGLRHTEQGDVYLTVGLSENPGMITFAVTDNGPGMTAEVAERIFDSYEELEDEDMATGMGLSICSYVAKMLGGSVSVDTSYAGRGTRFVFVVPIEKLPED